MITDVWATRIWGTADGGSATYSMKIKFGGKDVFTIVAVSKAEFTDEDDHAWFKVAIRGHCFLSENGNVSCPHPDPPLPNPTSFLKVDNAESITYELQVRNDDGYVYADCPIMVFFRG